MAGSLSKRRSCSRCLTGRQRSNEKVIDIELAGELIRVPVYRIRYADMLENYVTIHAAQDYTFKMMLGDLQNELDDGTEILLPQV